MQKDTALSERKQILNRRVNKRADTLPDPGVIETTAHTVADLGEVTLGHVNARMNIIGRNHL